MKKLFLLLILIITISCEDSNNVVDDLNYFVSLKDICDTSVNETYQINGSYYEAIRVVLDDDHEDCIFLTVNTVDNETVEGYFFNIYSTELE